MGIDISGFTPVFNEARKEVGMSYDNFRSDPAFHFLRPVREQVYAVDHEALKIALDTNVELALKYLRLKKPNFGYEGMEYHPLDMIDCRHIMMSTVLFDHLPNANRVIEIGGGFGNWARLNIKIHGIRTWSIIDLDFVLNLQRWYLEKTLSPEEFYKVYFTDIDEIKEIISLWDDTADVAICSHSLSEVSLEYFMGYLPLLKNIPYIFYARHQHYPNPDLSKQKLDILLEHFNITKNITHENGLVDNFILKRK